MQLHLVRRALGFAGALSIGMTGCSSQHAPHDKVSGLRSWLGPQFFGAGLSGAGQSIAAGLDTVTCGDHPAPAGSTGPVSGARSHLSCFYGSGSVPQATVEWIVESASSSELVHVRLTMNPDFVDNTYGENSIGWPAKKGPGMGMGPAGMGPGMGPGMGMGHAAMTPPQPGAGPAGMMGPGMSSASDTGAHSFKDLVESDHAEFKLSDAAGALVLHFKADYISATQSIPATYESLGVSGGDGKMISGSASDIVAVSTSLARNLNECGLGSYTVSSPATDANYTPNPAAPDWDYRVVYDVWVKADAFGSDGFGEAVVDFVHASPSKADSPTVTVTRKTCPPEWNYCNDPNGCADVCVATPDKPCAGSPPPHDNAGAGGGLSPE
jgi:hypothetical protein